MIDTILLHFLDKEVIKLLNLENSYKQNPKIYEDIRFATKLAFLICINRVIIPASNYFESPFAKNILSEFKDFVECGYLGLISSSTNSLEFLEKKQEQYAQDRQRYPIYFASNNSDDLANSSQWIPRSRSATKDISKNWVDNIDNRQIWERLYGRTSYTKIEQFEIELSKVPERLENAAFISDFVIPLVKFKNSNSVQVNNHLNKIITKAYIESFLNDFNAVCMTDFPLFDTSIILPENRSHLSVRKIIRILEETRKIDYIKNITGKELLYFKQSREWDIFIKTSILPIIWENNKDFSHKIIHSDNSIQLSQKNHNREIIHSLQSEKIEIYKKQSAEAMELAKLAASRPINITQTQGNNMAGDRNIHMGDKGNYIERNEGDYVQGNKYMGEEKQTLAEAAAEIQALLKQLEETYPTDSTANQMVVAAKAVEKIEGNPTLKQKAISAVTEGGIAAFEKAIDNPAGAFIAGAVKGWKEAQ